MPRSFASSASLASFASTSALVLLISLISLPPGVCAAATAIGTCGQVLSGAGVLTEQLPDQINLKVAKVLVKGSTITGNGEGLRIRGPAVFTNSAIDDDVGSGVVFDNMHHAIAKCRDSTFDRNGLDGLQWTNGGFAAVAKLRRCSANDNGGRGIYVDPDLGGFIHQVKASDLTVTGNASDGVALRYYGYEERNVTRLKRATVTGNGGHGLALLRPYIESNEYPCDATIASGSVLTGNGTGADCGVSRACADIATCAASMPDVSADTTCDTSYVVDSGIPGSSWGICTGD